VPEPPPPSPVLPEGEFRGKAIESCYDPAMITRIGLIVGVTGAVLWGFDSCEAAQHSVQPSQPESVAATDLKKRAENGDASAQFALGVRHESGDGVPKDAVEAVKWYRLAAEQGDAKAQAALGALYFVGEGVPKDAAEAVRWFRLAAEQGDAMAHYNLGVMYANGEGVPKDAAEAVKWYRLAAEQGDASAQYNLSGMYWRGQGVPQNYILAYHWANLAAAGGADNAPKRRDILAERMSPEQIAEAQRMSAAFQPKVWRAAQEQPEPASAVVADTDATGSGFFVTDDGYFITNHHVVADARRVRVRTPDGVFQATVVRVDASNDLAVLKVAGTFPALHVRGSRDVRLADRVSTMGFPNPDLQGWAAKHSGGEVAALSGPNDDPRFLQISVPIQPGNSGGPLVDASGSVVGVVVAQLDKITALKITGNLPENVNYAVKGTILLGVLEGVAGLGEKLKPEPKSPPTNAAEVAKAVEAACGIVLVEK